MPELTKAERAFYESEDGERYVALKLEEAKWAHWKADPIAYARERLKVVVWKEFGEILESVRDNVETEVQSANSVGKTFAAAVVVLWFIETHYPCKIITTGSSWRALTQHLWRYIHTLAK